MYAHGDILIIPTDRQPSGDVAPLEDGRVILARGEVTGHHHSIDGRFGRLHRFRPDDAGGLGVGLLVIDGDGARLEHQEHAPIDLAPGTYLVRRQREHSFVEEARLVAD